MNIKLVALLHFTLLKRKNKKQDQRTPLKCRHPVSNCHANIAFPQKLPKKPYSPTGTSPPLQPPSPNPPPKKEHRTYTQPILSTYNTDNRAYPTARSLGDILPSTWRSSCGPHALPAPAPGVRQLPHPNYDNYATRATVARSCRRARARGFAFPGARGRMFARLAIL